MSELAFRARRRTGLSQRGFAALIDVHPGTVARWETGERRLSAPAHALLRLIAAYPGPCLELLRASSARSGS